jgi:hypothetical protein
MDIFLVEYSCGIITDAVLLSATPNSMRLAVPREGDVLELRRNGADWVTTDGKKVTIGAILRDGTATADQGHMCAPRTALATV